VLVADDNATNQAVAARMLEKMGYAVDVVATGREALDAVKGQNYAAVLMDGQMPVMDGYEATRAVRALESGALHTPIIALTASAMSEDRTRCLDAGMDDFIAKPVTPEQLASVLSRWVPLPAAAPPPVRPVAPVPAASTLVTVDGQVLRDVLEVADLEFVRELVAHFHVDARATFAELREALERVDLGAWRRIAHKFRGSCAGVGARGMMELTSQMESLEEPELPERGGLVLTELVAEHRRVAATLATESWLDEAAPPA
jgi:CheY-like chemotaxis protein/HPt (histidine-containing phosphotransfer) domain-containing protein